MDSGGEQAGGIELSTKRQCLRSSIFTKFDFVLTIGEKKFGKLSSPSN
jgi:hypothetical protein